MRHAAAILLALLGVTFAGVAILRWQMPYNEEGRYFDSDDGVVYFSQAAGFYSGVAATLILLALVVAVRARRAG